MPRWLDRPRRAGEAERAVNVRHHRRGRYSPYRRVVSLYPVVHGRLERASSAERMTPTEHVASRIVLDGGRTEGHGYAGQACPGRRCVRGRGRTHHGCSRNSCRHSRSGQRAEPSRTDHQLICRSFIRDPESHLMFASRICSQLRRRYGPKQGTSLAKRPLALEF